MTTNETQDIADRLIEEIRDVFGEDMDFNTRIRANVYLDNRLGELTFDASNGEISKKKWDRVDQREVKKLVRDFIGR